MLRRPDFYKTVYGGIKDKITMEDLQRDYPGYRIVPYSTVSSIDKPIKWPKLPFVVVDDDTLEPVEVYHNMSKSNPKSIERQRIDEKYEIMQRMYEKYGTKNDKLFIRYLRDEDDPDYIEEQRKIKYRQENEKRIKFRQQLILKFEDIFEDPRLTKKERRDILDDILDDIVSSYAYNHYHI